MLSALSNALKIKELRKKIFFVLGMIAVYRLGAHVPVPGINPAALKTFFSGEGVLGFLDMFAGGALKNFTIFALSISPYITASIVMNLLTVAIPKLEEIAKRGPEGKKLIGRYTRYAAVVLAVIQGTGITFMIRNFTDTKEIIKNGEKIQVVIRAIEDPSFFNLVTIIITLTAGTMFLMWLGEKITEKGIGNGISILIFVSIISRFPTGVKYTIDQLMGKEIKIFNVLMFIVIAIIVIALVIYIQEGQRKIPVRYSKRVVGRKVYGGQSTHIPLKVNQAGVIPVIFASSLLLFPATVAQFIQHPLAKSIAEQLTPGKPLYMGMFSVLIVFFTYFYTAIQFNPYDIADTMKSQGGFIPGRRPGKPTAEYLQRILNRIILAGAVFLALIAILPNFVMGFTKLEISFGGTGLLIVVGVALQTMQQVETYLLSRHYEGFIK